MTALLPLRPNLNLLGILTLALTLGGSIAWPQDTGTVEAQTRAPSGSPELPDAPWVGPAARARSYTVALAVDTEEGKQVGTGVIYDSRGFLVTSRHLLGDATTAEVALPDGQVVPARLTGRSAEQDLAFLALPTGSYQAAEISDAAALQAGEEVLAAGFPPGFTFGADPTFTRGIVSKRTGRYLQTDAPINPGMSGGPVIDRCGRVVAIIESRYDTLEGRRIQGIGFAISGEAVRAAIGEAGG